MQTSNLSMAFVDLSISRKGLMLVSVPLVFEIVFVGALLLMLQESERRIYAQAQSKDIVATTSDLGNRLTNGAYMLFLWRASHSDECVKRFKVSVEEARKLCSHLSQISRGNERREKHAKRVFQIAEKIIYLTSNFARTGESSPLSLLGKETYCIELERSSQAFLDEERAITQEEQEVQAGGSASEQRAKSMVYCLIFGAVAFNVLLTILLAVYFSKNITRRLSTVMQNTELLAQSLPLNQPVEGRDEIASLDRVFHKMAAALTQSERMKSEFVSMITHDLKAPLTSIQTAVNLLSPSFKNVDDEKQQRRFGVLERNVLGMIKLVTDLLDMDKLEAGALSLEIEKTEIGAVLVHAVESMRFMAEQYKVELKCEKNDYPIVVECDPRRIEQVLVNLITNAIKFSKAGDTVTLSCDSMRDYVDVSVTDQGRGIPAEDLGKIFDRFKQVEQEDSSIKGGTGLGLAICKALVELHNGNISVKSKVGSGSIFSFRLPVKQSKLDASAMIGSGGQ